MALKSLGLSIPKIPLPLITGSDYQFNFTWQDPAGTVSDFPDDVQLYLLVGDPGGVVAQWFFEIQGPSASIKKESEVCDLIPDRTPYRLMLRQTSTTPTTETALAFGLVKRLRVAA